MAKKLFIGGLSWNSTAEHLREAFEEFGEISETKVITDRNTGRSRGFGFVTFVKDEDADKAVQEGNGAELDGRTLKVSEANEKGTRGNQRGQGGGNRGGDRGYNRY